MKWEQRLKIIKQKIKSRLADEGLRDTDVNVAAFLETSTPTYNKWKNNKQMPDVDTFATLATKLNLSANWLLLGIGEPEVATRKSLESCDVHIADTLRDLVAQIDRPKEEIAIMGGMYPIDLEMIINRTKKLPAEAVQRWVHGYRINANFLLAQVGQPFLTDDEYADSGPLQWVRERRGDLMYEDQEDILSESERAKLFFELTEARKLIQAQEEALLFYREKYGPMLKAE